MRRHGASDLEPALWLWSTLFFFSLCVCVFCAAKQKAFHFASSNRFQRGSAAVCCCGGVATPMNQHGARKISLSFSLSLSLSLSLSSMVIVVDVDVGSRRRRADGLTSAVSPFTPAPFCPPHPPTPALPNSSTRRQRLLLFFFLFATGFSAVWAVRCFCVFRGGSGHSAGCSGFLPGFAQFFF